MLLEYIIYSYYIINITWFNLYYWEANDYSKYPLFSGKLNFAQELDGK